MSPFVPGTAWCVFGFTGVSPTPEGSSYRDSCGMSSVAPVSAQAEGQVVLSSVTGDRAGRRGSSFSLEACDLLSIKKNWFGRSGVLGPAPLPTWS